MLMKSFVPLALLILSATSRLVPALLVLAVILIALAIQTGMLRRPNHVSRSRSNRPIVLNAGRVAIYPPVQHPASAGYADRARFLSMIATRITRNAARRTR